MDSERRVLVVGNPSIMPHALARLVGHLDQQPIVIGVDVSEDRFDIPVVGWADGDVIHWHAGDVRVLISGPYARHGWASRCLDPASGLWETFRLSRRAARRQRGRARAAARLAARRAIGLGPSSPLLRRG